MYGDAINPHIMTVALDSNGSLVSCRCGWEFHAPTDAWAEFIVAMHRRKTGQLGRYRLR